MGNQRAVCLKETSAISATISISVEKLITPSNPSPNSFMQQNERKSSRTRGPRGKSPSGRMSRWPCKDYLRGTCNNSFCEKWHPPECLFYKTKSGCRFGEKCSHAHRQVDEQPTKRSKKNDDKSAVARFVALSHRFVALPHHFVACAATPISLRCHTISLRCHTISLRCHTVSLRCRTISLRCHTISLRCHTISLRCHTISLRCHTIATLGSRRSCPV